VQKVCRSRAAIDTEHEDKDPSCSCDEREVPDDLLVARVVDLILEIALSAGDALVRSRATGHTWEGAETASRLDGICLLIETSRALLDALVLVKIVIRGCGCIAGSAIGGFGFITSFTRESAEEVDGNVLVDLINGVAVPGLSSDCETTRDDILFWILKLAKLDLNPLGFDISQSESA
jgi:hypothetical protein